jgi:hypothetical protein
MRSCARAVAANDSAQNRPIATRRIVSSLIL